MQKLKDGNFLVLRLESGEDLISSLTRACEEESINAGFITAGVGMLTEARIGYYTGERYDQKTVKGPHELISMTGSIARAEGKPHLHIHVALANSTHNVVGGHLFSATVHVVNEILITTFPGREFHRLQFDQMLKVLDLMPGP